MAVGRRKSLYRGVLATGLTTLLTAGAAPADGSARLTVWIRLVNASGGVVGAAIQIGGQYVYNGGVPANSDRDGGVTVGPFDVAGTDIIAGSAATGATIYCSIFGVEATDA